MGIIDQRSKACLEEESGVMESQGPVFRLHMTSPLRGRRGWGQRRPCLYFTEKAHRAMVEEVKRVDWEKSGKVVSGCLTYPPECYPGHAEVEKNRRAFLEWLRRHYRGYWGFWKKEFQENGRLHIHLVLGGLPYIPIERVRAAWARIIGAERTAIIEWKLAGGKEASAEYVAKYVSKAEQEHRSSLLVSVTNLHVGRFRGTINRAAIPWHERTTERVPVGRWVFDLKRIVRRKVRAEYRQKGQYKKMKAIKSMYWNTLDGFRVFVEDSEPWWRLMWGLIDRDLDKPERWFRFARIPA